MLRLLEKCAGRGGASFALMFDIGREHGICGRTTEIACTRYWVL